MQENELIGIAGVFVLTFCLILLYHFMSRLGSPRKRYDAQIGPLDKPKSHRRSDHDWRRSSGKDDAWLLWRSEPEDQAGSSNADDRQPDEFAHR